MIKNHTVLVVDDSPTVRRLVTRALSHGGYTAVTAENGEEGFKTAQRERPSVILVDFVMPKMNGFEFCKKIRSDPSLCTIPIVLITSKGKDVGKGFKENFGISHYLQKPFEPEMLITLLNDVLSDTELTAPARSESASPESQPSAMKGKKDASGASNVDPSGETSSGTEGSSAVWENISRELTALLKSAVIQTLRETDIGRPPGHVLSGNIEYISVADIIKLAGMACLSGKLSVSTETFSSEILFENGEIVFASIKRHGDRMCLEAMIVKESGLSPEAVRSCFGEAEGCSLKAGNLLVERGLLTENNLHDYYERMTELAVSQSLSATSGHFHVEDVPLPQIVWKVRRENKKSV